MTASPSVTAVVLAYGEEPYLDACVDAIAASTGVELDLVVVDNGGSPAHLAALRTRGDLRVVGPAENRGFAGGCNFGAAQGDGDFVVLVNSDAYPAPDAIARLVAVAARPEVGIASASIRLAAAPDVMNSAGNPVHVSGLTWAGAFEEPAADHQAPTDVASASGAGLAMRRALWEQLGGFDPIAFAYLEDTELSLRCWQRGLAVRFVPDAVVLHEYEFGRNARKFYLLERNRLLLLLTLLECRTLLLLAPLLLVLELLMLTQAVVGRWLPAKLRGWWWLLTHTSSVVARRRVVRGGAVLPDGAWMWRLTPRIEPTNVPLPPGMSLVNDIFAGYWRLVRGAVRGWNAGPG
ncbi:MAG: glycosyl transferase family 2 [Thermoleophilia bacterium]|nr:glycosyl transferase family 2 [Thermoleophilia bacterium]